MKRLSVLAVVLFAAVSPVLQAEEGMWTPAQLPELAGELKRLGLELDPSGLTDLTAHPMNAVISLGGCTASFVSPAGLVITNHHCAYGAIQHNSTEDDNLFERGFLAESQDAELSAGPGRRVLVTVEFTDVTERVLGGLPSDLSGRARYQAIEEREKALVAECERDAGHRCRVASFYGGLEYWQVKQLEIRDVRLVYAPPESIDKYGGDVDNWMWPRHTGDFAFYRAYVGPDGKPADHSEDNVPYRPRHFLRVAPQGLAAGDLVLVAGYPGNTNRYRLAREVRNRIEWYYPTRRRLLLNLLETIETATADRPDAAIKYAGLMAGLNNASKNYEGMLDGFAKSDIIERKQALERRLRAWIVGDPARRARYLDVLDGLERLVEKRQADRERSMFYESFVGRSSLLSTARTLYRLSRERQQPDAEREPGYQERDLRRIRERLTRMDRSFDPAVDRAAWSRFIRDYAAIPVEQHVAPFDAWFGIAGTTVDEARLQARLDEMYGKTKLGELDVRLALMEAEPSALERSDDPFIRLAVQLFPADMELEERDKDLAGRFSLLRPQYMAALVAYLGEQGRPVYPDANGTLRVTYGTVEGYSPRDALRYTPFTTLQGLLEKQTGEDPFDSPAPLLEAVRERRFGPYRVEALDSVPVNFLSTVDTTGGNSGSPTLNGRGELVGLLFDGNWESIIADWDFIPRITRSIHVDIRYVLWVMSEIDQAHHLLRELGARHAAGTGGARAEPDTGGPAPAGTD